MRPKLVIAGLALGSTVLMLLVALVRLRAPGPAAAASRPVDDELATLRRQVATLDDELRVTRALVKNATTLPAPAAERDPATSSPPSPEQIEQRQREHVARIEADLRHEPMDAAWSAATQEQIEQVFGEPAFAGHHLISAACRSTACRIEVEHDADADRLAFQSLLPRSLRNLPSGTLRGGDGAQRERRTVAYLAREGHRIPRFGER